MSVMKPRSPPHNGTACVGAPDVRRERRDRGSKAKVHRRKKKTHGFLCGAVASFFVFVRVLEALAHL